MKKLNIIFLLLFLNITFVLSSQTAEREIYYDTYIYDVYAVPTETNMDSITDMDLTKMMSEDKSESIRILINSSYEIAITRSFNDLPQYEYNYQKMVGESVSDKNGTSIYDRESTLLEQEISETPDEDYIVTEDEISNYGVSSIFDVDMSDIHDDFEQNGFNVSVSEDGVLTAINDSIEIYIDSNSLSFEYLFFTDDILERAYSEIYIAVNDYFIPKANVTTTYETLFSGTRCQRSEVVYYESYYVRNQDGDTIVEYSSEVPVQSKNDQIKIGQFQERHKKNTNLKIYPNPVDDILELELPYFLSDYLSIQVIDATGVIVLEEEHIESGSNYSLNVINLKQGIYFLRVGNNSKWKTAKFIKL